MLAKVADSEQLHAEVPRCPGGLNQILAPQTPDEQHATVSLVQQMPEHNHLKSPFL